MANQAYYSGGGGFPQQPSYSAPQPRGFGQPQGYGAPHQQPGGYPEQQQYAGHQPSVLTPPPSSYQQTLPGHGQDSSPHPQQPTYAAPRHGQGYGDHSPPEPHTPYGGGAGYSPSQPTYRQAGPGDQRTQQQQQQYPPGGPDGERGLGATLVGGCAAGWAAHKAGGGLLGSLGAAAAGAVGANVLEHALKKKHKKK